MTAVSERIQPSAQDHVLAGAVGDRLFHDVFCKPGPHAHPTAKGHKVGPGQLGAQPLLKRYPLVTGQARSKKVIDDPGRAFLAVDSPGNRCQHSCTAWLPRLNRSPHARQS